MAKLEKVLVAYDGSLQSKEALQWAIHFSRRTGVSISAAKVFEPVLPEFRYSEVGALPQHLNDQIVERQCPLTAPRQQHGRAVLVGT